MWIAIAVFTYLTLGTICGGLNTRLMRGDSSLFGLCFFFWPLILLVWFFVGLYALVAGKKFYELLR